MSDSIAQFIKLIAVILFIGVLLAVGALVGVVVADTAFGPKAADFSNLTYPNPTGESLHAYLNSLPATGSSPAVIMLPDMWGLNTEMTRLANFLSERGYSVLVPDLYRGAGSGVLPRALLLTHLTADEQVLADIQTGYDYLMALDGIDLDRIAVIGFGYGGGVAVRYASHNPDLAATITVYGDVDVDDVDLSQFDAGPVLGVFGAADSALPLAGVEQFGMALAAAGIAHEIEVYDNVGSGFIKLPDLTVFNSAAYNAWNDMVAFLDATLKA